MIAIRKRSKPITKTAKVNRIVHSNTKSIVVFLILVILIASGVYLLQQNLLENGETGEDFEFTLLDGTTRHLSYYRGKVVILDMWATWCSPCQFQMTELKKIYENYSRNDLEIISIDIDSRETVQLVKNFRDTFKQQTGIDLNWIFGMDDGSIWNKYQLEAGGIPTLYIFDKNGKVIFSDEGIAVYSDIPPNWPSSSPPPTKLRPIIDELLK